MKKVYLGVGHGGTDAGAVGYILEKDVNLNMALACRDYLIANGVDVKISRTTDKDSELTDKINECNQYNPDLAIDIHNNSGGGDGFEVYHTINGGVGKTLAQNIEAEVKSIGQNSRGLKTRKNSSGTDYFGFIRQIKCPSIITETVFVDNKDDASQADSIEEQKKFGIAIARGVLKTLNMEIKSENVDSSQTAVNKNISNIQSELNNRYGLNIKVDNIYGAETKKGLIKALQEELNKQFSGNLEVDGIFGEKTKNACATIGKGAKGNITWVLQAILVCKGYNISVDGDFGTNTEKAVKDYQAKSGISVDGIAGANTFYKLFE